MSDLSPDERLRQAQIAEYSQFTANKPINIRGARAFNEGDRVPASHVERGVVSADDVEKVSTTPAKATGPTSEKKD